MYRNLNKFKYTIYFLVFSCVISTLIFYIYTYFSFNSYVNLIHEIPAKGTIRKIEALGYIGSYAGGIISPLLSAITVAAIFYTMYLQRYDNEQNKTLIEKQSFQIEKQNFENTFFSLLSQHNQVLNDISSPPPPYGLGSIHLPKSDISETYFQVQQRKDFKEAREYLVHVEKRTDHYFRIVYQILKFIDKKTPLQNNSQITEIESKKIYSSMLRALINQEILILIALNACSTEETPSYHGYKNLIEKFEFLEHLKIDNLIYSMDLIKNYKKEAFGDNIWLPSE